MGKNTGSLQKALVRKTKTQENKAAAIESNQRIFKVIVGILAFMVGIAGIALLVDFFRRMGAEAKPLKNTQNPHPFFGPYRNASLSHPVNPNRALRKGFSPKHQDIAIRTQQKQNLKKSEIRTRTTIEKTKAVVIYFTADDEIDILYPQEMTREEAMRLLKEGINQLDPNGLPPLHVNPGQNSKQRLKYFEFMLEHGANPNFKVKNGWTPIEYIISASSELFSPEFKEKAVELLLRHGARPVGEWKDSHEPAIAATNLRLEGVLKLLLRYAKKEEDILARLLFLVAHEKSSESLAFLNRCGIDLSQPVFSEGETLFHAMVKGTIKSLNKNVLMELTQWVDIHVVDANGHTALDLAVEMNNLPMVDQLLNAGASSAYHANFENSYSPFARAFYNKQIPILKMFLEKGYQVNEKILFPDKNNLKPPHLAAMFGDIELVELFHRYGAVLDLNKKNIITHDIIKPPLHIHAGTYQLRTFLDVYPWMSKWVKPPEIDHSLYKIFVGSLIAVVITVVAAINAYPKFLQDRETRRRKEALEEQRRENLERERLRKEAAKKSKLERQQRKELQDKQEKEDKVKGVSAEVQTLKALANELKKKFDGAKEVIANNKNKLDELQNKYNRLKDYALNRNPRNSSGYKDIKNYVKDKDYSKDFSSRMSNIDNFLTAVIPKLEMINNTLSIANFDEKRKSLKEIASKLQAIENDVADSDMNIFIRSFKALEESIEKLDTALRNISYKNENDSKPKMVVSSNSVKRSTKSKSSSTTGRKGKVCQVFSDIKPIQTEQSSTPANSEQQKASYTPWDMWKSSTVVTLYDPKGASSSNSTQDNLGFPWGDNGFSVVDNWRRADSSPRSNSSESDSASSSPTGSRSSGSDSASFSPQGSPPSSSYSFFSDEDISPRNSGFSRRTS